MRLLAAFAVLMTLAACAPQPETPRPTSEATLDIAACKAEGGAVMPVCRMQKPMCVLPYRDAGKSCTDNDQCEGRCVAEGEAATAGTCETDNDPCGCVTEMVGGKPRTICVD